MLVPVGVSNRHVHVSQNDLDVLYGEGYQLTVKSHLAQTGQYAANETVTIKGIKGAFENVRILGPVRNQSQVEISLTDTFRLGIDAPIRESGCLDMTPGIELIGPMGSLCLEQGTIVALRHIHMHSSDAIRMGINDKEIVAVQTSGIRRCVLENVLVRVSDDATLEMHIDIDEANACALRNGEHVFIVQK